MHNRPQINRIRTIKLTATNYETDLYTQLMTYDDKITIKDENGDNVLGPGATIQYYEIPDDVKLYKPTIRKISLDVSSNCYLVINDEYFNPIYIRMGGVTTLDVVDVDIKSLKLLNESKNSTDIEVYAMVGS